MLRPLLLPLLLVAALPAVHGTATNCSVGTWQTGDAENFYREPTCDDGYMCQFKMIAGANKTLVKQEGACVAPCGVPIGVCMILKGTVTVECCLDDVSTLEMRLREMALLFAHDLADEYTIDAANLNASVRFISGGAVGESYHLTNTYHSIMKFTNEASSSVDGSVFKPKPKPEQSGNGRDGNASKSTVAFSGKTNSAPTATLCALAMTVAALL